jgi:hypothetical protein
MSQAIPELLPTTQPPDKHGVVAHTPDPTRYFAPDDRQMARIGAAPGAVIARASEDGASRGFNAHKAGTVIVDPDMDDGGFKVNLADLTEEQLAQARNGVNNNPTEVLRRLSDSPVVMRQAVAVAPAPRENPVMAGYIVPQTDGDGRQIVPNPQPREETMPAMPAPAPTAAPLALDNAAPPPTYAAPPPAPEPAQPPPTYAAPPPVPVAPAIDMTAMAEALVTAIENRKAASAPPPPAAPAPVPAPRSMPSVGLRPFGDEEAKEPMPLAMSLKLAYITGTEPVKPSHTVIVDLGAELGQMSARYHDVVEGNGCLALVYDTRYEEGQQWAPPTRGDRAMTIHCAATNKTYTACSMGIQFPLGVLDVIVLIINEEDQVADPEPEQEVSL